jgi:DNA-binding NtrC family response regulator
MEIVAEKAFNPNRNVILLITFASRQCITSLVNVMCNMEFDLETIAGNEWLMHQPSSEPGNTIILLDHPVGGRTDLVEALLNSNNPRLLVMANSGPNDPNSGIIGHFQDFITWPCSKFEVRYRMERLFRREGFNHSINSSVLKHKLCEVGLIGQSSSFLEAMSDLLEFAASDAPVLIKGETGTGKELAARAVHDNSIRAEFPFICVNCGAIPDNLIENELFGHDRGAYTDAKEAQKGMVAQAHRGTLFLDEVDTLSPIAQVSLLRYLETGEYRPLGGKETKFSDARIVAATNADLEKLVQLGKFRRDLLFRLDVCGATLPSLRERGSDIDLLANHFLKCYAGRYNRPAKTLHPGTLEWMRDYKWDGNIRELDNLMHRLFLVTKSEQIFVPKPIPGRPASSCHLVRGIPWHKISYKEARADALDTFERSYLNWLMKESRGNLSMAARRVGQQRSTLRRMLTKHGIDKNAWKE